MRENDQTFITNQPINFLLNDLTTPKLIDQIPIPTPNPTMPYMIIGFDGGGSDCGSYAGRAATCYCVLATCIQEFLDNLGKSVTWSSTPVLVVDPAAGFLFNAYYDRGGLKFFFNEDTIRNKLVFASGSADIVAHELGHALLDAIRPDFWQTPFFEIAAFHESYGDIHSLTSATLHNRMIMHALIQTQGHMENSNSLSMLAEEFGMAVYKMPDGKIGCLRDATNQYKYQDPNTLLKHGSPDQIVYEPHSFSRIMTGAIYEIMVGIYRVYATDVNAGLNAFRIAGKTVAKYMIEAASIAQIGANFYQNFASSFYHVDQNNGGKYSKIIQNSFTNRNIMLNTGYQAGPSETIKLKLSDFVDISCQSNNPLLNVLITVPVDRRFTGIGINDSWVKDTKKYLDFLHETNSVGYGKEFSIKEGELVRNWI